MENKKIGKEKKILKKFLKRGAIIIGYVVALNVAQQVYSFATDDPITVINNLSDFIFGLIRAVGMIILGFGVVQVGMSLKSHDPTQRANGIMTLAGGIVITFSKEILNLIKNKKKNGRYKYLYLIFYLSKFILRRQIYGEKISNYICRSPMAVQSLVKER